MGGVGRGGAGKGWSKVTHCNCVGCALRDLSISVGLYIRTYVVTVVWELHTCVHICIFEQFR